MWQIAVVKLVYYWKSRLLEQFISLIFKKIAKKKFSKKNFHDFFNSYFFSKCNISVFRPQLLAVILIIVLFNTLKYFSIHFGTTFSLIYLKTYRQFLNSAWPPKIVHCGGGSVDLFIQVGFLWKIFFLQIQRYLRYEKTCTSSKVMLI